MSANNSNCVKLRMITIILNNNIKCLDVRMTTLILNV